jgi:hypothetical protein
MITRPVRERKPETIQRLVEDGVKDTGFEEVGLLSLSSADHSAIGSVARDLADEYEGTVTSLSLPSTRVDAFNVTLSNELSRNGRRTGLTFAPEAGSDRMRAVINKMVSEEDLLRTTEIAFSEGWRHVKLYFMVGLPTERDEDVLAIADLGIRTYERARKHGKANKVTISVGGFVPKPHTPFQWAPQDSPEEIRRKLSLIRHAIKDHGGLKLRTNDPEEGVIEGLLARGRPPGRARRGARLAPRRTVRRVARDADARHLAPGDGRDRRRARLVLAPAARRERGAALGPPRLRAGEGVALGGLAGRALREGARRLPLVPLLRLRRVPGPVHRARHGLRRRLPAARRAERSRRRLEQLPVTPERYAVRRLTPPRRRARDHDRTQRPTTRPRARSTQDDLGGRCTCSSASGSAGPSRPNPLRLGT